MERKANDKYSFSPNAMLPAWVVADDNLVVRNRNNFAFQLLGAVGKSDLFFNDLLSLRLNNLPSERHESLWKCILDPKYPNNIEYVAEALRLLEAHVAVLASFHADSNPQAADLLVAKLKQVSPSVNMQEAVVPYIIRPRIQVELLEFVMGVKISPPQGLKLIRAVELENSVVEFVDIVMAYRLRSDWTADGKLRQVSFLGTQPAIHDATFRHGLWEKAKLEDQAEITQFLSHAFKTPISNIQSMTRELQFSELSPHYREVCEKLEAQVADLSNLSDLILFINSSEPIPVTLCGSAPADDAIVWLYISIDEIKDEIAKTIQSIHRGRTRNPVDKKKINFLGGLNEDSNDDELNYAELADRLIDASRLGERTTFGLLLPRNADLEAKPEKADEIAKKARTTFLNLLLAELFLNAVKYSDSTGPEVKISFRLNAAHDSLEIDIVNNGTALTASEFKNARKELANKPGEKRRALGLLLNLRAAEILGWQLQWTQPSKPGTHLTLRIPFTD